MTFVGRPFLKQYFTITGNDKRVDDMDRGCRCVRLATELLVVEIRATVTLCSFGLINRADCDLFFLVDLAHTSKHKLVLFKPV